MLDETSHAFEIIRSVSHMSIMIIFVYSIDIEKIRMQSNIMLHDTFKETITKIWISFYTIDTIRNNII